MAPKRSKKQDASRTHQALLKCLREAKRVNIESGPLLSPNAADREMEWFESAKGGVKLTGECVDAFSDVVDALEQDNRIGFEYSVNAITKRVKSFLLAAVLGEKPFDRKDVVADIAWNALKADFGEKHRRASYFVPIVNLDLSEVGEIVIGAVKIYPYSESAREKMEAPMAEVIRGTTGHTDEEKERLVKSVLARAKLPANCCVAEISMEVNPDSGHEFAAALARESVAILRLLAPAFAGWGPHPVPALLGEVAQGTRVQTRLVPGQEFNIDVGLVGIGPMVSLKLTRRGLDEIQGEFLALGMAVKPLPRKRADIEKKLATALRWYSDAIVEPELNARFLKFCISLEALLLGGDTESITTRLAQSVAVLLADDCESRLANERLVKDVYYIRSRIAHEGRDTEARRHIEGVRVAAALSILRVAQLAQEESIRSADELTTWVKRRLYG